MDDIFEEAAKTPLPALIDKIAALEPGRLYVAFVESIDDESVKLRQVTYAQFANAVNRFAWRLRNEFGKSKSQATIAYVGPIDLRYVIVTVGCVKAGYKALLLSPQNPISASVQLLSETNCKFLLRAFNCSLPDKIFAGIYKQMPIGSVGIESLEFWLDDERVPMYPFTGTLEEVRNRAYVVVHSSGSTGYPKPITYTMGSVASLRVHANSKKLLPESPPNTTSAVWRDKCHFLGFPPFHMIGTMCLGPFTVLWNSPYIIGPHHEFNSPRVATLVHKLEMCQATLLPPSILQRISQDCQQLEALEKLNHVLWAGAPQLGEVAQKLKLHTKIYAAYGSTEAGPIALSLEDQMYHEYMTFSPLVGVSMRHFADDLYELVIVRSPKLQEAQFVFFNFPHLSEWRTKDLFSKHPDKGMWKYRGRADDTVILTSSFTIQPHKFEEIVNGHTKVAAALLAGDHRPRPAWLIEAVEPPNNVDEASDLAEDLWPTIQQVNDLNLDSTKVAKKDIVFTTKDKPMVRASKGSVQRRPTYELYQSELAALYEPQEGVEIERRPQECLRINLE